MGYIKFYMPLERPRICAECPLLGKRPKDELPAKCKYTMKCFLPGLEKYISGRGSKQENARFRCKRKEYKKIICAHNGEIKLSPQIAGRYDMEQMKFIFEIRENRLKTKNG